MMIKHKVIKIFIQCRFFYVWAQVLKVTVLTLTMTVLFFHHPLLLVQFGCQIAIDSYQCFRNTLNRKMPALQTLVLLYSLQCIMRGIKSSFYLTLESFLASAHCAKVQKYNRAKQVSNIWICGADNAVEHYGQRVKVLHGFPAWMTF